MKDNFDPMTMVPQDDEEALKALEREDKIVSGSLQGIFQIRREKGESLLDAYEAALKAHLEAIEKNKCQSS